MPICRIAAVAATLSVIAPAIAEAQQINGPFQFQRRGGGEAVGMSPAYRQAILERELLNRRPRNLVRDRAGFLLEADRGPSNQAFLREQAQPFLVPSGGGAGVGIGIGGFSVGGGLGLGVAAGGLGYGTAGAGPIFLSWSSMVGEGRTTGTWNGTSGSGYTPASAVIDGWIMQLAELQDRG